MNLENKGSLITYGDSEQQHCLGYLLHFPGRGVYDANLGKVDVTDEEADIHNKLLDEALLKGLDENCQIGQGNTFYYHEGKGVITFVGTVVSADVTFAGQTITFRRGGKVFRGRLQKDADCFNFRRVA